MILTLCRCLSSSRCVFYGDLYGCGGENPQKPVNQLEDIVRCRKFFAHGELRDYWDHRKFDF